MEKLMPDPGDYVGVSFWIISAAMVAATFFFWVERDRAVGKWKTSLTVAAMVTGIAAIHYFYMRGVWAMSGESPTVFRYVDWLLTVPLQIVAGIAGVILAVEAVRTRQLGAGVLFLAMFCVLPPVSAVALYYFGVHSLREWQAVREQQGGLAPMLKLYAPFSLPVLIGGAGMVTLVSAGLLPLSVAAGLGMALAIPHMAPFERWVAASRDVSAI
jgi:hypothetical protein